MSMIAERVRLYGNDRTVLMRDDGTELGWIDNLTGEIHTDSEQYLLEIRAWVADRGER